ncbi:NAD(P)/FAD-dependent oxidoreductase [Plastoroseomonas arctica]|uniref:NAD(P)/FAD-dependent oxidoreductase n=1 Tax=Plastoroseomonas arctica TaxID=1509237 RepID=A0AAF1K5C0_9PROT|nr:FAD-dependent oxidoreductase [Plastoroseomonas arctica]MBR0656285.1 NAD(P)/FAD-dependent oxidoreductase [Plastoroseomonas arctica]
MRVLVIGAGPAGTRCAVRIAERLPGTEIVLAGAESALPYDRIALSKVLEGRAEVGDIITHPVGVLRAKGIAYRPATRIVALDCVGRAAVTEKGERVGYDACVIATGSRAARLPLPGADLPGVLLYRDLSDVLAMRRAAMAGGPAVVIGGGLLGLEAAAGLAHAGMKVTVIHAVDWPMERQLDAEAGAMLARRLGARGIRFAMPAKTAAIAGDGRAEAVLLADGTRIPARLVVMSVGIRPETGLAAAAGLAMARGIVVDDQMRTSDPAVFAIGECAEHGGKLIGLVAPALEQAEIAAEAIAGGATAWAPRTDSAALKVSGTAVWSAGEIAPADAEVVTLRDEGTDAYRRFWLREGRLVGAVLYGDTDDSGFYLNLITSGCSVAPFRAALAMGPAYVKVAA